MAGTAITSTAELRRGEAIFSSPEDTELGILIHQRLSRSSYYHLRPIQCDCRDGIVTLRGHVPTFFLKQTVQSTIDKIEGVRGIINLVEVAISPMGS